MINSTKIQEWIRQIEDYPLIAPFIIRRIADRLIELDSENEELRAQNLSLRDGQKIKEYEQQISDLEYQIELLKRQLALGGASAQSPIRILAYRSGGSVLSIPADTLQQSPSLAPLDGEVSLLGAHENDELLFLFNSGRVETYPVRDIPKHIDGSGEDAWTDAYQTGLRGREELSSISVITAAPLLQSCVQISRKGYIRCVTSDYFRMFLSKHSVGSGVKIKGDELFHLLLCNPEDVLVLISKEGLWFALSVQNLSPAVAEAIKLSMDDYLVSAIRITSEDNDKAIFIATSSGNFTQLPAGLPGLLKNTAKRGKKAFTGNNDPVCGAVLVGKESRIAWLGKDGVLREYSTPAQLPDGQITAGAQDNAVTALTVLAD